MPWRWRSGRAAPQELTGLIHHSDRGVQYLAIRYTERLAEAGAVPSVGSRGDSYDNALAESFNGLYKTELIRHAGPWRGLDDVEYATLEYVDWFNHRRLHGELGHDPARRVRGHLRSPTGHTLAGQFPIARVSTKLGAVHGLQRSLRAESGLRP